MADNVIDVIDARDILHLCNNNPNVELLDESYPRDLNISNSLPLFGKNFMLEET